MTVRRPRRSASVCRSRSSSVPRSVSDLRSALGDDSRTPRLIRTLHRFGYRFDGAVRWEDVTPAAPAKTSRRACLIWASREFPLACGENIIGRDPDVTVSIDSAAISRRHAKLTLGECAILEDLGSKNGTSVDRQRITSPVEVHDGDVIGFGSVNVVFRSVREVATTMTDLHPLAHPTLPS